MIEPLNTCHYTYFLSVNADMDHKANSSKKILGQLLGTSFRGETYKPHITAYYYEREENDEAVKRQALSVLESIRAEALLIKGVEHFSNSNSIVYTFQNPEWIINLNTQLCIAHRKKK